MPPKRLESGVPQVSGWSESLARQQYTFMMAERRAMLALEAVKLNVLSSEQARDVVLAFIVGEP